MQLTTINYYPMKLNLLKKSVCLLACLMLIPVFSAEAQKRPSNKELLSAMELANDYFMNKWPDTGLGIPYPSRNKVYESNLWTRAVYYEGLMGLYSVNKDPKCLAYAVDWGEKHKWDLRRGYMTRNADNQCCGQIFIELYNMDPKPERIEAITKSINLMMDSTRIDDWWWIDAIQMAMPIFVQMGVMTGDTAYFNRAYDMYNYTKNYHGDNGLYNPKDRLWWRDADFDPPYTEPNGEDCYWSRGNGWVVAAMARVLDILPENEVHRGEYIKMLQDMCEALLPLQREDGFWNVSLHDPNNYGGKELTGTALFVYGMAYGVNHGYLDAKIYAPVIYKAWNAMVKDCLHPNGFLGYVQGTGKEPKEGQPVTYTSMPDFEDYGLGCFLLAGSEIYKMK